MKEKNLFTNVFILVAMCLPLIGFIVSLYVLVNKSKLSTFVYRFSLIVLLIYFIVLIELLYLLIGKI